jgi:hypothetical protein
MTDFTDKDMGFAQPVFIVNPKTGRAGGTPPFHLVSAASVNATVVKASYGVLTGYNITNRNASSWRKVVFHNSASAPTAGANVYFSLDIPPGGGANMTVIEEGIPFSNGIAITTVTEIADNGTTAVGAGDLNINLFYK